MGQYSKQNIEREKADRVQSARQCSHHNCKDASTLYGVVLDRTVHFQDALNKRQARLAMTERLHGELGCLHTSPLALQIKCSKCRELRQPGLYWLAILGVKVGL